jgi:hypothetical protein
MRNIKTTLIILIQLPLLTACWGISLKADTPDDYTNAKNTIESFYGSPANEVVRSFGEPQSVQKKGETTYYIYEWRSSDIDMAGGLVFILVPVPFYGS